MGAVAVAVVPVVQAAVGEVGAAADVQVAVVLVDPAVDDGDVHVHPGVIGGVHVGRRVPVGLDAVDTGGQLLLDQALRPDLLDELDPRVTLDRGEPAGGDHAREALDRRGVDGADGEVVGSSQRLGRGAGIGHRGLEQHDVAVGDRLGARRKGRVERLVGLGHVLTGRNGQQAQPQCEGCDASHSCYLLGV